MRAYIFYFIRHLHPHNKRFVSILGIVVLLVGLVAGVNLVQHMQIFTQRAATTNLSLISTLEYGSTPITEFENYPKPQNHLQHMVFFIVNTADLDARMEYLAKEMDYVWFDQSSLSSCPSGSITCDFSNFYRALSLLKQFNSNVKTGVHAGAAGMMAPYHLPYSFLTDGNFLHKNDGSLLYAGNNPPVVYLNMPDAGTRNTIANAWATIFSQHPQLDGIAFDSFNAYGGSELSECREGDCRSSNFWIPNMIASSQQTNSSIPSEKDVTYNGIFYNDGDPNGQMGEQYIDYHDGVLVEHPHRMYADPLIFKRHIEVIKGITDKGKKVFFWVQPKIFDLQNYSNYSNDINLERFFLASYLLIQQNPLTYFGYHPGPVYNGTEKLYFYKDWNLDFGTPTNTYLDVPGASNMFYRRYTKGDAVVNPTNQTQYFLLPSGDYREWDPVNGPVVSGNVAIPPRSGKFLFSASSAPAPSATPGTPVLQAEYQPLSVPGDGVAGKPQQFTVKVTNTGSETWLKKDANTVSGRVDLGGYIGPDDEWTHSYASGLAMLSEDVPPGGSTTIPISFTMPQTTGTYTVRFRMVKQGFQWFDQIYKTSIIISNTEPSALTATPKPTVLPTSKNLDLNGDGKVNIGDLNTWFSHWKTGNLAGDVNGDGKVNGSDYSSFINQGIKKNK